LVSDVLTLEKHSMTSYVSKSKEPVMAKIREFSLLQDRSPMSRSTVLARHCDQGYSKSIHGQWPRLMDQLKAYSFS